MAGGVRELSVAPERLERFLENFLCRHSGEAAPDAPRGGAAAGQEDAARSGEALGARPPASWSVDDDTVTVVARDGTRAECRVPFPPLRSDPDAIFGGLVEHVCRDRRVGVVLVRLGGYAAGVFEGSRLVASKVGSRLVHGRSAAGGWSQQRFARRREKQAREAFRAAADVVARIVVPVADTLDAVVVGGDRRAVAQVLDDPRLAPLRPLVVPPHLTVPDPKLAVLQRTPEQFRSVRVRLVSAGP
jgi:hypothetical protein